MNAGNQSLAVLGTQGHVWRWLLQNGGLDLEIANVDGSTGRPYHLTGALGFSLGRKPLRDGRRLPVGFGPDVTWPLGGDPDEVGSTLAIVGTAGVRFDAVKQRPSLCGAEIDFLEASEPLEAL